MLMAMLGSTKLIDKWWNSPNKAFNGMTPNEVPIDEVYVYILKFTDYVAS